QAPTGQRACDALASADLAARRQGQEVTRVPRNGVHTSTSPQLAILREGMASRETPLQPNDEARRRRQGSPPPTTHTKAQQTLGLG
ncbi:MAG: hypothetical protein V3U27_18820, partial [Candidatus Tectomicrobia bacterium]